MKIAVWAHPYAEFPSGHDSADDMAARLEELRAAGIELYLPFVAVTGDVFFQSDVLGPPLRDLLGPLMDAAERVGMQVHPILGLGGTLGLGRRPYKALSGARDVPEYALTWPCASWGENHERALLAANEIIERYHPDGIHLDYSRYPNSDLLARSPCACDRCRQVRLKWLGKPVPEPQDLAKPGIAYKELQMRIEFVRSFVESMRGLADHHGLVLSASVRPRYYDDALPEGQDWAEWCADGLLDICCPMSFTESFGTFALWTARHHRLIGDAPVSWLAGIARHRAAMENDPEEMARQIRFAHSSGAQGVAIFSAGALGEADLSVLRELAEL